MCIATVEPPHESSVVYEKNGLEWWEWRHPVTGVRQIELTGKGLRPEDETERLLAGWAEERDFEILAEEDVDIYKPRAPSVLGLMGMEEEDDSEKRLLVRLRKNVIPKSVTDAASDTLRDAAKPSESRGNAAGRFDPDQFKRTDKSKLVFTDPRGIWAQYLLKDGSLSRIRVSNMTNSGIIGAFDRNTRNPYCRETGYSKDFPDRYALAMPLVKEVDRLYRALIPSRFEDQKRFIATHRIVEKGWSIAGTVFTTATVNYNFRTGYHRDAGDLPQGFGNLTVVERGDPYNGGYTVFPRFRIAVNLRTGDFLGMDVHEIHGNCRLTARYEDRPDYGRISLVCYCRELMNRCGTREEELERFRVWARKLKERTGMSDEDFNIIEMLGVENLDEVAGLTEESPS